MDASNTEFIRLLADSGWSKSEAARRLSITPPAVTQYCNGDTRPSDTILNLFRLLIGERPAGTQLLHDGPGPLTEEERGLIEDLRESSPEARRQIIDGVRTIIKAVPKRKISYGKK